MTFETKGHCLVIRRHLFWPLLGQNKSHLEQVNNKLNVIVKEKKTKSEAFRFGHRTTIRKVKSRRYFRTFGPKAGRTFKRRFFN